MTQEEKQILNRTLLCLLPYNTKVSIDYESYVAWLPDDSDDDEIPYKENLRIVLENRNKSIADISKVPCVLCAYVCDERFQMMGGRDNKEYGVPVEFIKPYLRPLSSMTEKEYAEFQDMTTCGRWCDDYDKWARWGVGVVSYEFDNINEPHYNFSDFQKLFDWLNAHHFDYRGLIPKGLAIEASEDMYKYVLK